MRTVNQRKWLDEQVYALLSKHETIHNSAELKLALRKWQLTNLYKTLSYAQNNTLAYKLSLQAYSKPIFRDYAKFNLEELDAEIKTILHEISPTTPQALAENSEAFLAIPHYDVKGIITSSGTSSQTKRIFYSEADMSKTIAFFRYGMSFLVDWQDKIALLMSGERVGSVGYLLQEAMRQKGIECHVLGIPYDEDLIVTKLIELGISCLVGVPSHILSLSKHLRLLEFRSNLRNVLLSGDTVTPAIRHTIAHNLNCEVFVHYGLTEFVLGGAVECNCRNACHLRELDLVAEIVNPQMQALVNGQWGELVLTSLAHQASEAMPLIRYKTGDYARILSKNCACGSILQRLEVLGRLDNSFCIDEQTVHIMHLDDILYAFAWIKTYSVMYYTKSHILIFDLELLADAPKEANHILKLALEEKLHLPNLRFEFRIITDAKPVQAKKIIQKIDK